MASAPDDGIRKAPQAPQAPQAPSTSSVPSAARRGFERLLSGTAPVVLMVSGGSDSTALLLGALACLDPARLHVLHVNHLLRGEAADADEAFVRALCDEHGVPCTVRRIDVGDLARSERGNVEAIGRRERYAAAGGLLDDLCARAGVPAKEGRLATGHTRDDRAETFLMRASVGTGPGGLASIRPLAGRAAHPLLGCSREELRAWLVAQGQGWREDATNLVPDRDRTFMRLEVLPLLRAHNPSFDANLERTMNLVADEDDWLEAQAAQLLDALVCEAPAAPGPVEGGKDPGDAASSAGADGSRHSIALDARGLSDAPRPLARRAVRRAFARIGASASRIGASRIDQVIDAAGSPGFAADLPGKVSVGNVSQTLVMSRGGRRIAWCESDAVSEEAADAGGNDDKAQSWGGWLAIPGTLALPGNRVIDARVIDVPDAAALRRLDRDREAVVDVGAAQRLWVSGPVRGERMVPLGFASGHKKLSDVMIDRKVPAALRDQVPVVRLGREPGATIVWVGGLATDERCKVRTSTGRAVQLALIPRKRSADRRDRTV